MLAALAEETDYDNFKSEVAHHQGKAGAAYEHSLHDVWSVMHSLQETEGLIPITAKQIDALLPFLERFEAAGFSAGSWKMPEGQFPWFDFNEVVMELSAAFSSTATFAAKLPAGNRRRHHSVRRKPPQPQVKGICGEQNDVRTYRGPVAAILAPFLTANDMWSFTKPFTTTAG